jgi:AcrR family transcriptional regulator
MKPKPFSDADDSVAVRAAAAVPERARPVGKRGEKSEAIRESLLRAAEQVVGEIGYANASITLITQKAGVAQGTFYNYFQSRQEILDALLPALGKDMLDHVKKSALGGHSFAELEDGSFRGFFDYLAQNPHFFRILNEADVFAPKGHAQHFDMISERYLRFLRQSHQNGEFPSFREDELETVVFILIAARTYLAMHYVFGEDGHKPLPEAVGETYIKFVRYGLEGVPPAGAPANPTKGKS